MRLTKFKVENFRSVEDSGWIDADRVTALVGVNESGKTNLLLPLWKLNPAREGELVPTSDYPKANYAAIKEKPSAFQFITAEFFSEELADVLAAKTSVPAKALHYIHVGRKFDGEHTVSF